jgi:hypothetical protein
MARVKGLSRLEVILAHGNPANSPENKACGMNLIQDVARSAAVECLSMLWKSNLVQILCRSWIAPQAVPQDFRYQMMETSQKELQMLLVSLPERFHTTIRDTLASLPSILSNPNVNKGQMRIWLTRGRSR